ncbi:MULTISPECIES: TonB-dependent receptor plug domain-containing protein [unclassified Polaribacter]|uniref:TonB-dependent receptor plug domain-containing protein n=1 Tax=unclassified Polaribacter TaxID=196858 RepID=UPI001C501953|nr:MULTISPECIES: TonB-dependent receptor plug domain-containing protein [unclassified Polaribacter]QXP63076.1 TonB-dependent receptor plug domain-containing protein [Polaribacter sp. HaHaR_3_91]QXP65586.1 TonB-dependent receptor plug domain-containing protein [Polaribacter sp. AHE13PA]QXP71104.1 TonB-dependent receptor plug domain-containing protein [Polaribacter sp. R2A056_3_33]
MVTKRHFIILLTSLFFSLGMNSQNKNITIRVKDVNNKPVSGAIILLDDVKQNVWTNSSGVFKTKLKSTPKEISAFHPKIGIKKIAYNGKENIIIKIEKGNDLPVSKNTKTQKSSDSSQFNSIYDYLRGQIAGVNVSSDEEITIRGYNSINGDMTPLFILNETTVSKEIFGNIRPLDIKSVTVLKGPETTRYGVRGANGVIIVTTK